MKLLNFPQASSGTSVHSAQLCQPFSRQQNEPCTTRPFRYRGTPDNSLSGISGMNRKKARRPQSRDRNYSPRE